jgi:tripartite-type tricarboxylate transporter receptor subunit TctC
MSACIRFATVALVTVLLAAQTAVAANFPERPVQLVVPFTAGGAADVMARFLANELEKILGQSVIVMNRPGAGSIIGAQSVASAQPDGYTLLISSNSTFSMNPAVNSKLPYNPATDFESVGMVAKLALAILTQKNAPIADIKQLVTSAKNDPTKYAYASFGNATSSHFAGEMFKAVSGIEMTHVPYRGSNPAMTDLLGGQVQISIDTITAALPHIQDGQVKALAVTTAQRSLFLPDIPTVAESGYPGFDLTIWIALVAPRGIPQEVKSRLAGALQVIMSKPEVQSKMKNIGFEPAYAPIENWTGFVTGDIARMREIATRAQIKAE